MGGGLAQIKSKASFVTRLKKNTPIKFIREHSSACETNIHSDALIKLATKRVGGGKKNPYQKNIRRVIVTDSEGNTIRLVTNDFDSSAKEISDKYRAGWKIELFFKQIKQKLKIKTFQGYSPNAIKTQIYVAMIAYLLLKMGHQRFQTGRSLKTFVRIIAEQLMIRHPERWRPFAPPKRRDAEKLDPSKQDLFSFHKIPLQTSLKILACC